MKLIAIAGGIGSGKSVLCRILSTMGYLVYDTDSAARTDDFMQDTQVDGCPTPKAYAGSNPFDAMGSVGSGTSGVCGDGAHQHRWHQAPGAGRLDGTGSRSCALQQGDGTQWAFRVPGASTNQAASSR